MAWLEAVKSEGHITKIPAKLQAKDEPPELFPDLLWIWQSFCAMSRQRSSGANGPNPISFADIHAYMQLTAREEFEYREQLLHYVPLLDQTFLEDYYTKQEEEIKKSRAKKK